MRKYIFLLLLFLSVNSYLSAQTITVGKATISMQTLLNKSLPLVVINTIDEEEPTFDPVETPEGCLGTGIANATKVPGRMYILLGTDTLYDSGDYVNDKSGLTIKIRGNSSAYSLKKPYKIKLQKKADLLCRGNDAVYKDKEWCLIRDEHNLTYCMTGFIVSKLMDFAWVPAYEYVNVVMNGIYRGIYLLVEQIKMNSSCRINVNENTGYIIENDPYWWNENIYFDSSFHLNYTMKYPDEEDVTNDQLEYIQKAVNVAEASLDDGTYPDYIDLNSFASWCLAHDLLGTYDEAGSNMYISKLDSTANSKLKMETPWDFDTIEQTSGAWANIHNSLAFFYSKLFNNKNLDFEHEYEKIWDEKKDTIVEKIIEELDSFEHSNLAKTLDFYSPLDKIIDELDYASITKQIEDGKQWFTQRKEWLNEAIGDMEEETGISTIYYSFPKDVWYDLQGRRVTDSTRGIVIQNGKKYLKK